jgi:hypothetical protein
MPAIRFTSQFTSQYEKTDPHYKMDRLIHSCIKVLNHADEIDQIIEKENVEVDFLWEIYYTILNSIGAIRYDIGQLRSFKLGGPRRDRFAENRSYYSESIKTGLHAIDKLLESQHGNIIRKRVANYVDEISKSPCPDDRYKAKVWKNKIQNIESIKSYRAV